MAEKSNANLFRNTDYLLAVSKDTNTYSLSWVAPENKDMTAQNSNYTIIFLWQKLMI